MRFKGIIILFMLISCCLSCNRNNESNKEKKIFLVFFDISASVKSDSYKKAYHDNFKLIETSFKPGDVVVAGLITENSLTELQLPINFHFDEFIASTDNNLFAKAEEVKFNSKFLLLKDSLLNIVDSLFNNSRDVQKTEILSSMHLAEKIFKSYPEYKKIMIIMSDMIEDSEIINLNKVSLNIDFTNNFIKEKIDNGEIPNLKDVKIYIAGAYCSSSEKYKQIQNFWLKYFESCNANLSLQNYNSALINFRE